MGTNVKSVWFACTRFDCGMLGRGSGAVINIASLAAFRGFPRNGASPAAAYVTGATIPVDGGFLATGM